MGTITRNFANFIGIGGVLKTGALNNVDLNPIKNDIATLALREAVTSNRVGTSLVNAFMDQFENSDFITLTNTQRDATEFISSVNPGALNGSFTDASSSNFNNASNWTWSGNNLTMDSSPDNDLGSSTSEGASPVTFTADAPFRVKMGPSYNATGFGPYFGMTLTTNDTSYGYFADDSAGGFSIQGGSSHGDKGLWVYDTSNTKVNSNDYGNSYYFGFERTSSGIIKIFAETSAINFNETPIYTFTTAYNGAYYFVINGQGGHRSDLDNIQWDIGSAGSVNATGSIESTTINPGDSTTRSKLGIIILYKNNAGTNTLNTDIVAQVSADNGSNYSTVTLEPKGNFDSSGTKIAIANDVSVTSGTDLKYKISFANQSASKEARITGVSLLY